MKETIRKKGTINRLFTVLILSLAIIMPIFSVGCSKEDELLAKVKTIQLDYSSSQVQNILGQPYSKSDDLSIWYYYGANVHSVLDDIEENEQAQTQASGEALTGLKAEHENLLAKFKALTTTYVEVVFEQDKVQEVTYDSGYTDGKVSLSLYRESLSNKNEDKNEEEETFDKNFSNTKIKVLNKLDSNKKEQTIEARVEYFDGYKLIRTSTGIVNNKGVTYRKDKVDTLEVSFFDGVNSKRLKTQVLGTTKTRGFLYFDNGVKTITANQYKEMLYDHIKISSDLITIGERAFSGSVNLATVTYEKDFNLQRIDSFAFENCKKLEMFVLSKSVNQIGESIFSGCSKKFNTVVYSGTLEQWENFAINPKWSDGSWVIRTACIDGLIYDRLDGLNESTSYAGLTDVLLSKRIVNIGPSAFAACKALSTLKYRGTITEWESIEKDASWMEGSIILRVSCGDGMIYESLIGLDSKTSEDYKDLTDVLLSKNIKYIGAQAFRACKELTTLRYRGTMAEWESIEKHANWNKYGVLDEKDPIEKIVCSDGTINLD